MLVGVFYLIENVVKPRNILAITFTNKAAREMKEKVVAITPQGDEVWVSTFHSACIKILRKEIVKIGYSNKFPFQPPKNIIDILYIHNQHYITLQL